MTVTEGWIKLFLLCQNQLPEPKVGWYPRIQKRVSGELWAVHIRWLPWEPTRMQPWPIPVLSIYTSAPSPTSRRRLEWGGGCCLLRVCSFRSCAGQCLWWEASPLFIGWVRGVGVRGEGILFTCSYLLGQHMQSVSEPTQSARKRMGQNCHDRGCEAAHILTMCQGKDVSHVSSRGWRKGLLGAG